MEIRVRDGAPSPPSLSQKSERKARVAMECSTIQLKRHERLVLSTAQKYLRSTTLSAAKKTFTGWNCWACRRIYFYMVDAARKLLYMFTSVKRN
jgi:hypothetical protein